MKSVFIQDLTEKKKMYIIKNEEYKHLAKALRLKKSEKIIGFDGKGNIAELTIEKITKNSIECYVDNYSKFNKNYSISVGIPIIKHKNFNFILKNIQQLGVNKIFPFVSEHSVVKNIEQNKISKWNKILIESSKQSKNFFIPFIEKIYSFNDFLNMENFELKIIFYEKSLNFIHKLQNEINNAKNILIIIGPEGGFSENEIFLLKKREFIDLKLNTNILRSETAIITVLSIVKYLKQEI